LPLAQALTTWDLVLCLGVRLGVLQAMLFLDTGLAILSFSLWV